MSEFSHKLSLSSPDQTADLAKAIAPCLRVGDVLLLDGPVGAGKTHFARCLIQSLQDQPEDVPSPTFTLVQTYDSRAGEIWHSDLYRLSDVSEIEELGLIDAFRDAICLVEWPDRLGMLAPDTALHLQFSHDTANEDTRHLTLCGDARWQTVLADVLTGVMA